MTVKDILEISHDDVAVYDVDTMGCMITINHNSYENGMVLEKIANSEVVSISALDVYRFKVNIHYQTKEE